MSFSMTSSMDRLRLAAVTLSGGAEPVNHTQRQKYGALSEGGATAGCLNNSAVDTFQQA
jgi:hypothetical protein